MSYETFKKEVLEKHNHTKSIVRYGIPRIKKDDQDMYKFIGGCTHNKEEFEDYARKLYHETGIRFVLVKTWKPYFLFSRGFKLSVLVYWRELCKYIISIVVSFYLSNQLIWHVPAKLSIYTNWFDWVLFAALVSIMFLVVSCCCLLIMTRGTRCLVLRIIKR